MRPAIMYFRYWISASLVSVLLVSWACGPAQPTVNGNDAIVEGCGDGVAKGWEECDIEDLRGADCTTLGLAGGSLACSQSCTYDTAGCIGCGNGLCDIDEDRTSCPEDCGARQVAAQGLASCAVMGTGDAYCWGNGASGMIGDGTFTANSLASKVVGGLVHQELSAGAGHMCSLSPAGLVHCWGNGEYLGAPNLENSAVPRLVEGIPQVSSFSASYFATCALGPLGETTCWGLGSNVTTRGTDRSPGPVAGLSGAMRMISCGGMHCCALSVTEQIWCWGRNENGVLGVPGTTIAEVAVPVPIGLEVRQLAGGNNHHCLLDPEGRVHCWGETFFGQCAQPDTANPILSPIEVSLPESAVKVAAGMEHSCALLESGKVYCWGGLAQWGDYQAQLGIGYAADGSTTPVEALVPVPSRDIEAGEYSTCVATRDGRVFCWGLNSSGEANPLAPGVKQHLPLEVAIPSDQ